MSALWAEPSTGLADREPTARPTRPRVIDGGAGTARLGRVPFVLALIMILGIGMAGLLALNTSLQTQAFEARSLHQKANQLTYQQASLHTQVAELRSSDNLAARAFKLGMRPDPSPGFIRLPDGQVIGKAKRINGDEVPMIIKTPEQVTAERKAEEAKKHAEEAKRQAAEARRQADTQTGRTSTDQNQPGQQDNGGRG
ncbi:hypothetical protein [Microlunatus sp. Gsoil 973]|uniref:hypothetical protein n=1 Tax=Microlunatus sp. Gsoil 973 TaxID=2672569 RepID=UPI0012B49855|nr:hypothetical protein [Microlunatus sp. Gsoil 973]QGN31915.1 hypothetical protein GJV80_02820 [Microlunatus sp. Gsoil 973]